MRVAVGGGRLGAVKALAYSVLDKLYHEVLDPAVEIVEGNARGYDRLAGYWARRRHLTNIKVKIDNERDGWRDDAPKRRNQRLIDDEHPDIFLAFDGGPGTRDMIERCLRHGIQVWEVEATATDFKVWEWHSDGGKATLITEGKIR